MNQPAPSKTPLQNRLPARASLLTLLLALFAFSAYQALNFLKPISPKNEWADFLKAQISDAAGSSPNESNSSLLNQALPQSLPAASRLALGKKIDLNQARAEDLVPLPGIGPKMAERIVADREEHGRFKTLQELMRVKGIKQKKFEKIKPYLQIKN